MSIPHSMMPLKPSTSNHIASKRGSAPHPGCAMGESELLVYSPDMSLVYHLHPSAVLPTEGSTSLFKNFDMYGVYMRKEHFVCTNAMNSQCPHGRKCVDIHIRTDLGHGEMKCNPIHRNIPFPEEGEDLAGLPKYPRHVPGKPVEVFDHKSRQSITVDSGMLLVTVGSEEYFAKTLPQSETPARMQQCTHFQRKHCLRGPECSFLHVLNYKPEAKSAAPPTIEVTPATDTNPNRGETIEGGPESPTTSSTGISFNEGQLPPFFIPPMEPDPPLPPMPTLLPVPNMTKLTPVPPPSAQPAPLPPPSAMQQQSPQQQVVYILPHQGPQMPQFMAMPPLPPGSQPLMMGYPPPQPMAYPATYAYSPLPMTTTYYVMAPPFSNVPPPPPPN